MITDEMQERAIERIERAIKARNQAFTKMSKEFMPDGRGNVRAETIDAFDVADVEFNSAKSEMDQIATKIRNEL